MAEFKWNLPKYNVFELQNISKDDPEYVEKMSAKYGLTWGEDLSKKQYKKWNAVVNQQKDIYNKYQYTPDVNILSKGGAYQKYDDLINKILAQGKATKEDNELLYSYKNELGLEDVTSDPSQSVIRTKILSGDALTKQEYSEFFGRLMNYELLPAWKRVGMSLGSAVLPAITALPELVGGKAQREVLQGRYADMKASARAGLDLTPTESFLWDTGESIVNNIASIVIGGKAAPYLMGTQAGVRKMSSVEMAGGTTFEAIASGLLAAGAEYLGEKVSIKGLEQLAKVAPSTFRGIIKAAAGQVLSEATEEVATEMMNILSDFVVLDIIDKGGTQSDLKKYFDKYLKEHPEARGNTAFWKTFLQAVQQIALAGAAGGISGGVMGGGQLALNNMTTQGRQNMAMYGADQAYRQAYEQSLKTGQITPAMQQKVVNAQNLLNKRFDTQEATQPVTAQSVREYVAEQDYSKYSKDANSQAAIQKAVVANKITTKEMDAVDAFAKKTKTEIKYEYNEGAPKGRYEGRTMVVNLAAEKAKVVIATHEYMHHLKDTDTGRFESVSKSVLGLKQYDDVRQSVTERYTTAEETRGSIWTEENGVKKVNQPALDEEIAANIVEAIIDKPDRFIKDVTSKPVRSKVAKAILDIYNRAKDLFTSAEKKEVREAYNKIVRAVKGSEAEADKGAGKANTSDEKTRYSLSTDSQGRKLSPQQQEFFKNSKARDEQGRLLEVYHGTTANEFTVFNKDYVGSRFLNDEVGFFFTNIKSVAKDYTTSLWSRGKMGHLFETYLNFENPLIVRASMDSDISGDAIVHYDLHNTELVEKAKRGSYDGIIIKSRQKDIADLYVAFEPNQIKLTTNLNPTASEDIRYSLTLEQARETKTQLNLPKTAEFINAVKNTQAAEITGEGLVVNVTRKQNPEQSGELSVRKGVFYLPSGDKRISYYGGKTGYGGAEIHTGKTLFKNPLFVKGATGGKAPEAALAQLKGKNAIEKLDKEIFKVALGHRQSFYDKVEGIAGLMSEYDVEYSTAYDDAYNIVSNSTVGNTLRYATREYIIGEVARQSGYDSIIGYSKDKAGNEFISEIFDLREKTYPSHEAESEINEEYLNPAREGDTRFSLDTEKAKLRARTRPGKEYTRAEAKEIVDGLLGDEYKGKNLSALSKSNYNKAVERLYAGLNAAKEGRRAGVALGVADMLINSAQNDFTTAEKNEIRQSIAEEILQGYENKGKLTAFGETVQRYIGKVSSLKAQLKDAKAYGQSTVRLMNTVRLIKDLKGVAGAARNVAEEFKPITKAFKAISGTHKKGSEQVREAFKSYARKIDGKPLYDILMDVEGQKNPFGDVIEAIASGKGQLSAAEINAANAVLRNYIHNAREYGKILIGEQRQDAKELSQKGIGEEAAVKARAMRGVNEAVRDYMDWTGTPIWTFRRMAGHDEGAVAMQMYYEIEEAINRRDAIERDMQMLFSDFFSKHGKEADKWKNARIDFAGAKISTGQAIALYLLSLREQAQAHLYNLKDDRGVIRLTDEKGRTSKDKYQRGKDVYFERTDIENLEKGFGEAEKAFISLAQEFFGTLSKDELNKAYNAMYGVDIANEKNYFPIHVSEDEIYREVGGKNPGDFGQLFSVRSPAFIKPTVEKAKNKVVVENAIDVINRHMHEVASFAALSIPMRNINRVLNAKQENGDTFLKALERVNPKFKDYLDKWLKDVQGIRTGDYTRVDRWIGKVRGMGARGALGLNPKVWTNQLVSLFAARGVGISYKNILYGGKQMFKAKKADFDLLYKYVPMAYARAREGGNIDVGLLKEGVGVIGKADKLTDLTTTPISKIDNLVVYGVWRAALKQTESQYTPYSEEHYQAAAELTKRAIIETQANYTAFARPEILRTNNELVRLFTMFMSEPLQSFSQIAGSTDAVIAAKQARKSAVGEEQIKKADKALKERTARLKAVVISTTVQAILLTLITRMAVWLKGKKKDEEENFWTAAGMDMLENYVGMFPLVRDLYSVLQGYDVTNMFQTGVQNMGDALKTIYNISAGQGDMVSNLRKLVLGVSQTFGVPLRNLETYVMGVVDKFSPEAAYKYNSLFYSQTYKKNLDKAIKDKDSSMANTVMERYMDDKGFKMGSYATRELVRLYSKDAITLPTGLNNTVTVNGETVVLTTAQYQRFKGVYSQAGTIVGNIITSAEYRGLTDEAKGKAISTVFDMFYAKAKTAVLKAEDYKYSALTAVPIRQFAPIAAAISAITASEESGSRRAQVMAIISKYGLTVAQRLFLMMYFGYTVKDGEFKGVSAKVAKAQVKAFVSGLSLSAKEKEYLLKKTGIEQKAAA